MFHPHYKMLVFNRSSLWRIASISQLFAYTPEHINFPPTCKQKAIVPLVKKKTLIETIARMLLETNDVVMLSPEVSPWAQSSISHVI